MPNMRKLGFFNIDGMDIGEKEPHPTAAFARMQEQSKGKDTTIGHWEIAGHISPKPMPTYPNGFPQDVIDAFSKAVGRGVLCNKPYSGTEVIKDYGEEHMKTGKLIVYTSADSVFQIAAHEDIVPVEELYRYCKIAREILQGEHGVGRVIARPFIGTPGNFTRTPRRHDFSLVPPLTMLNQLQEAGKEVLSVGKIKDIFAGSGITDFVYTSGNEEGIERTLENMDREFEGLSFTNLVDYDMLYGHRNDVDGYAKALTYFDQRLPELLGKLLLRESLAAPQSLDPIPVCFMVKVHFVTSASSFVKNSQRRNGSPRQRGRYARNKKRRKSHGWPQRAIHGFFSAILFCLTAWSGGLSNISRGQCVLGLPLPIPAFSISWRLHYPPIPLPRSSPRSQV